MKATTLSRAVTERPFVQCLHKRRCCFTTRRACAASQPQSQSQSSFRLFSSSRQSYADTEPGTIQAAPEIDFSSELLTAEKMTEEKTKRLRIVPASPSYFTAKPVFTDDVLGLQNLVRKYQTLPVCKPEEVPRIAWKNLFMYQSTAGREPIRASEYTRMIEILKRLNYIHPAMRPREVTETLEKYKRDVDPLANRKRPILIDEFGRARGVGRRKSSSAEVWLVEGEGEVLINGKTLSQAFARLHDRESVVWALKTTERLAKYNVWGLVRGGGTTGQAEALTLGITKALMAHEPSLKGALRRAGVVARDPRRVERKKPGKLKARKMPAWVKR